LTPKLNVWRLQAEKRYVRIKGERQAIIALVLRDQHGKVKQVAKDSFEQARLKRWYRLYNQRTKTEDLPVSKKLRKEIASVKRKLMKEGFTHRELCYGTTLNRRTGEREYKRMEVFKKTAWTRRERGRIWYFFKAHMPRSSLGIYVIKQNKLYMYPLDY
jgi:hypothetical protein